MSTRAQRVHFDLMQRLADRITEHRRPERPDRRGQNMTTVEAVSRARNGRIGGPKAKARNSLRERGLDGLCRRKPAALEVT